MHEFPITQNILEIAQRHAETAGATRVTDIYLVIGQLSSVIDDSVQFYWDIISRGTICEGARLHFDRRPAALLCLACGQAYTLDKELAPCPKCGSVRVKVTSGDEFRLESIAVET